MATPTYDLIETTTLTSAASSVTFSSITQDYRDLVLVIRSLQTNETARALLTFNNDTGANYNFVGASGNGNTFASYGSTGDTQILGAYPNGLNVSQIMDYSATDKHKTVLGRTNGDFESGVDGAEMRATRWADTSAITKIEINSSVQNFPAGSTFSLYGIAA